MSSSSIAMACCIRHIETSWARRKAQSSARDGRFFDSLRYQFARAEKEMPISELPYESIPSICSKAFHQDCLSYIMHKRVDFRQRNEFANMTISSANQMAITPAAFATLLLSAAGLQLFHTPCHQCSPESSPPQAMMFCFKDLLFSMLSPSICKISQPRAR